MSTFWNAQLVKNDQGDLAIDFPDEVLEEFDLNPGDILDVSVDGHKLLVRRPETALRKLIEDARERKQEILDNTPPYLELYYLPGFIKALSYAQNALADVQEPDDADAVAEELMEQLNQLSGMTPDEAAKKYDDQSINPVKAEATAKEYRHGLIGGFTYAVDRIDEYLAEWREGLKESDDS